MLIVIDEAGRLLGNDGNATSELSGVLSYLRNRLSLRGRVLLLSDVVIERNRWSEVFPIKTLSALPIAEAVDLLTDRLVTSGYPDAVPTERKADLVRILGQNPRAIETLVATLTFESLDEVIGHEPGLWEVTDRAISREFLEALERRLLERTLSHLQPLQLKRLSMLAVHRKSFEAAAFEVVTSGARKEWRDLRHNLVSRFLVSLRLQWHALNPLVREISLSRLRESAAEFKTAHALAADHHMRHFRAKNIVLDHQNLTGSYAELRYHLFNAGRTQQLRDVALRLCDHFTSTWNAASPVPQDRAELDERIGVLSALLQDGGPKSLEYYLARCLKTRGSARDLEDAVVHVSRATEGKAPAAAWLLRAQLHSDLGYSERSIQACIDAVGVVDPGDAIGTLYVFGARVLFQQGKVDDAVAFLRTGILIVPPSKNLFTLYQSAAELLGQAGKPDAAVELLKEGIKVIPADKNLFALYQSAVELLGQSGKADAAVELLKEGIKVIPADKSLFSLYQSAAELLAKGGMFEEAVVQLRAGIKSATRSGGLVFHLYQSAAELLQRYDRRPEAIELLRECIRDVPGTRNSLSVFKLAALLLSKQGMHDEAFEVLEQGNAGTASSLHQRDIYYRTKAELLAKAGRPAEAQACLEQGVAALKPDENRFALFQLSAALLRQAGDVDGALRRLQEGIGSTPYEVGGGKLNEALCQLAYIAERREVLAAIAAGTAPSIQRWMATVLLAQLDFDWPQAAGHAKAARAAFPSHAWFATAEAFCGRRCERDEFWPVSKC